MIAINITEEEKLMYQVMGAVYRSRVPVDFKGCNGFEGISVGSRISRRNTSYG